MISCISLTKYFGEQSVLLDIDLEFSDNGLFLLLGESGSGKTTFLSILSGMISFDRGNISIDGQQYHKQVDAALLAGRIDYIIVTEAMPLADAFI